ncbi:hypothetical protein PG997_013155 [Apiospora hydei]|uniref:Major facilitator superfamily (MFS) profile domain-containing protein n=1 Tax=Apiospora hydei TaxID=1337664 RepID=A0ABR1V8W9_9PEZI
MEHVQIPEREPAVVDSSSSASTAAVDAADAPQRTKTRESRRSAVGPDVDLTLPYRTLSADANFNEYLEETITGTIEVTFVENDPENPKNWSKAYKWYCTMVVAITCFVVAFASSVVTADIVGVADEFHVSEEVALLSITLFVVGFGVGPMAFAPLSEIYGRRILYASTLLLAVVWIIPCAVAKGPAVLLVFRALDGIAFSAPMTLVGGTLADLWHAEERGIPMAAFSAAPFIGPAIGPLVGGYLSDAAGWRWLYWIQLILSFVVWVLITFTVPETYAPTILKKRAAKMRKESGKKDFVTEQELDLRPLSERLRIFLVRPFQLLFGELIVFLISLYMSVLYGLLYMFFVAYPIIFQKGKGYSAGTTGLMFIPVAVGVIVSAMCSPWVNQHYLKDPPAELRLIPMMCSCWFIPIGLIIFAWTSYPHLIWHQAASALAAKTFIRSFWGAAVVLFTEQMYDRLGYQWASTLLFFISLACCGIPFLFWKYGEAIRRKSKYAYSGDEENNEKQHQQGRNSTVRENDTDDDDLRRARSYVSNP